MNADTTNPQMAAAKALGDCWATHPETPGPNPVCCIKAALDVVAEAASIERGREIAVSMMDRAEAACRHEHGQPHLREHCETCAEEYWVDRLRPVHYREAAASLDNLADAIEASDPANPGIGGIRLSAIRLRRSARDMEEDSTDGTA